jgi:DNA-binding LytR/AlgR family response regulator
MMSVAVIEDDPFSSDMLIAALEEINNDVRIVSVLRSVNDAVSFLKTRPSIDLVFSDVQLKDGLSFSVFEEVQPECPVIFISAFDQYVVNAFEYSGIDYLLKPVSRDALQQSINKYKALENHFLARGGNIKSLVGNYLGKKKSRIIVKKGYNFISLSLTDIVLFYTENLVVYALDQGGNKYIVDKNLNTLEEELDPGIFFRANRQYIVNVDFILGYKSYQRVKLFLTLKNNVDHVIVVGQEKAKAFRKWLAEG